MRDLGCPWHVPVSSHLGFLLFSCPRGTQPGPEDPIWPARLIPDTHPKWIMLDGDLDANWIESMNSAAALANGKPSMIRVLGLGGEGSSAKVMDDSRPEHSNSSPAHGLPWGFDCSCQAADASIQRANSSEGNWAQSISLCQRLGAA